MAGFSNATFSDSPIFIKHLGPLDLAYLNDEIDIYRADLIQKGVPTQESQLEYLSKEGLWTQDHEDVLKKEDLFLDSLRLSKKKQYLKAQIDSIKKLIHETSQKVDLLRYKKAQLLGSTVETFCNRRTNELYIFNAIFKDKKLKRGFYSEEEFLDVDAEELESLTDLFEKKTKKFDSKNLKELAISVEFMNFFYLCDNNPWTFYGRPVCNLTYYQTELFGHGIHFKNLLNECDGQIPPEFKDDPDGLIEWIDSRKTAHEIMEKNKKEGGAVSLIGGTKEDYQRLGIVGGALNLNKIAESKGGHLSMSDFLELEKD